MAGIALRPALPPNGDRTTTKCGKGSGRSSGGFRLVASAIQRPDLPGRTLVWGTADKYAGCAGFECSRCLTATLLSTASTETAGEVAYGTFFFPSRSDIVHPWQTG